MVERMSDLLLSDVVKRYETPRGPLAVLDGVSLSAAAGETIAIVGPSGSGKSTLLHLIGSLDRPTAGTIRLGGTEVTALAGRELARFRATQVGLVFQDHHLLPQLTAMENVLLPTLAAGTQAGAVERARVLLEHVGVLARADAFPAQMSGGERQRVALARALINSPRLLLCDEPTGNLDREAGAGVVAILWDLAREQNGLILMVTHNAGHAAQLGRRLELRDGRLVPPAAGVPP